MGRKRASRNSWCSKTNESLRSNHMPGRCIDVPESAVIAPGLHGRKQGCVDWWDRVGSNVKDKTIRAALVAATKSEVINAVSSVRNGARNAKPAKRPPELLSGIKHGGSSGEWTSPLGH